MSRAKLIIATGNPGKLREFREILGIDGDVIGTLADVPQVRLPEEGLDYEANAVAKARAVALQGGHAALADDSGLEVDGLDGAPGPLSARFGGPDLDDAGRVTHLLAQLAERSGAARSARFVCVAALVRPDGRVDVARGECEGEILKAPVGEGGFGYDPIFRVAGRDEAMAQLPAAEKNVLSHRGRALAALRSRIDEVVSE